MTKYYMDCCMCEEGIEYDPKHIGSLPPGWALRVDKKQAWCPKHAKGKKE